MARSHGDGTGAWFRRRIGERRPLRAEGVSLRGGYLRAVVHVAASSYAQVASAGRRAEPLAHQAQLQEARADAEQAR